MNRRARAAGWILAAIVAFILGASVGRTPFHHAESLQEASTWHK